MGWRHGKILGVASLQFDQREVPDKFIGADFAGAAGFFKAKEIPEVGKITVLLRLDGLDGAVSACEKNARAVGLFLQGQAAPVVAQAGEPLDEVVFATFLK